MFKGRCAHSRNVKIFLFWWFHAAVRYNNLTSGSPDLPSAQCCKLAMPWQVKLSDIRVLSECFCTLLYASVFIKLC